MHFYKTLFFPRKIRSKKIEYRVKCTAVFFGTFIMSNQPSHPYYALISMSFNELLDRFSFYGLQSSLLLILVSHLGHKQHFGYMIFGAYLAMSFSLPLLGGYLADKYLKPAEAILYGTVLVGLGNIFIVLTQHHAFLVGLAIITCGTGMMKANNSNLLGYAYANRPELKESGFTLFYMAMNIGAILGPVTYGFAMTYFHDLSYGFAASGIGMFLSLCLLLWHRKKLLLLHPTQLAGKQTRKVLKLTFPVILVMGIVLIYIIFHSTLAYNTVMLALILAVFLVAITQIMKNPGIVRLNLVTLLILIIFAVFFFVCQIQISGPLVLLAKNYLHIHIAGVSVPPQTMASLEPFFVIITAPLFAPLWTKLSRKHKTPSINLRIFLGLAFATGSFGVFYLSTVFAVTNVKMLASFIIIASLLLGAGELCIGPALTSAVTYLAPKKLQGTFMGIWWLSIAFSGYIGGWFDSLSNREAHQAHQGKISAFQHTFGNLFIMILVITLLMGITWFLLARLKDNTQKVNH